MTCFVAGQSYPAMSTDLLMSTCIAPRSNDASTDLRVAGSW